MTDVSISALTKSFGPVPVLRGIDLRVPAGSMTAVLGPSGCGKTTLLRLIGGFDRPDSGLVTIGDLTVAGPRLYLPPERRHVGYVAQEGALFPHLTVAANIAFGLSRHDGKRVAELLELVGLDQGYARRYPHQLSGGQQQRVALARALAPSPAVILLDEPFSSLDAGLRDGTRRAVLDALNQVGTTSILVTHDQAEALSMAAQVAVMRDGRLAQVGTPEELYVHPADLGIATFLGDAIVLPATVSNGIAVCALGHFLCHGTPNDGPASIVVRPEQITLGADRPEAVGARVLEVTYYGPYAAVKLQIPEAALSISARTTGFAAPHAGDTVEISVQGRVMAYPK